MGNLIKSLLDKPPLMSWNTDPKVKIMKSYILECINPDKMADTKRAPPIRKMVGWFNSFDMAHWVMDQLAKDYEDILIHELVKYEGELPDEHPDAA
jgi:hypothetical protein